MKKKRTPPEAAKSSESFSCQNASPLPCPSSCASFISDSLSLSLESQPNESLFMDPFARLSNPHQGHHPSF